MNESIESLIGQIRDGYDRLGPDTDFEHQKSIVRDEPDHPLQRSPQYLESKYLTPSAQFSKEWLNQLQEYVETVCLSSSQALKGGNCPVVD